MSEPTQKVSAEMVSQTDRITSYNVCYTKLLRGRRRPVEKAGSEFDIELNSVIMSLGTTPNPLISSTTKELKVDRRRCVTIDEMTGQTSKEGVFAGGDVVTGAATVILAMGAGKTAATGILV